MRGKTARAVAGGLLCVLSGVVCPAASAVAPQRVVSLNLCSDELLLLLAAPEQLASVTWLSRNPQLSLLAKQARRYPGNRGGVEEVMSFSPDLVLAGRYGARQSVQLLRQLGVQVELLEAPTSLADVMQQLRDVGRLLGRERAGRQLAETLRQALAELGPWPHRRRPVAAVFLPNGYTSGPGSLMHDLLTFAGLDNLAVLHGRANQPFLPLEILVRAGPDLLILDETPGAPALAHELRRHPVFRKGRPNMPLRLQLPPRYWTCGTPAVAQVAARLRAAALTARREGGEMRP